MADGSRKPIEQVGVGDRVKACDPAIGEVIDRMVVRTFRNVTETVVNVSWVPLDRVECLPVGQRGRGERHSVGRSRDGGESGEDGEPPSGQTVRCTPGHPWWVESQQRWVLAGELRRGDWVLFEGERSGRIEAVESRRQSAATYNFEVEVDHSYFVSQWASGPPVLVHNASWSGLQGLSHRGVKRLAAAARRLARAAGLPRGRLVAQGSRVTGTARVGASDIDIGLIVDKRDFGRLVRHAIESRAAALNISVPDFLRTRLGRTIKRYAKRGQPNSFLISREFNGLRTAILGPHSPYDIDFSVIMRGSILDTPPFLNLGR